MKQNLNGELQTEVPLTTEIQETGPKTINWWKWLFIVLLAANIAFFGVIVSRLFEIREPHIEAVTNSEEESFKVGSFTATRSELNDTVTAFLSDYQTKDFKYSLYATSDQILFEGTYTLLGYDLPLNVYFTPTTLDSGAIQLTVESFSVGTLPLPETQVLKYIKSSYDLPDIVEVVPKESIININVQDLENQLGVYLKASNLDLYNNEITFDIYKEAK